MDFTPAQSQQAVAALAAEVLGSADLLKGPDPWKELARAGLLSVGPGALSLLDTAALLTEISRRAPPSRLTPP